MAGLSGRQGTLGARVEDRTDHQQGDRGRMWPSHVAGLCKIGSFGTEVTRARDQASGPTKAGHLKRALDG